MHNIMERLAQGDTGVAVYFKRASDRWRAALPRMQKMSDDELADFVSGQFWFEHNCGGKYLGTEVMVWSAIGFLHEWTNGFATEEDAKFASRLIRAFRRSSCSKEVHGHAERAARCYNLT